MMEVLISGDKYIQIIQTYKVMGHRWLTTQATSFFRV